MNKNKKQKYRYLFVQITCFIIHSLKTNHLSVKKRKKEEFQISQLKITAGFHEVWMFVARGSPGNMLILNPFCRKAITCQREVGANDMCIIEGDRARLSHN